MADKVVDATYNDTERRYMYTGWIKGYNDWSVGRKAFIPSDIDADTPSEFYGYRRRSGKYGTYYGSYVSDSWAKHFAVESDKDYDETSPQVTNIRYIYTYLSENGWHRNAITAVIGNMHAESKLNPGAWQSDKVGVTDGDVGFGLVQWTPGAKKHLAWCMGYSYYKPRDKKWHEIVEPNSSEPYLRYKDPSSIDSQLEHLLEEMNPSKGDVSVRNTWAGEWNYTGKFPLTKKNFINATDNNGKELSIEYLTKAFVINYLRPGDQSDTNLDNRVKHTLRIKKYVGYSSEYLKRTTDEGVITNPIKPCYDMNNGYNRYKNQGNCTWYAYGRAWEINANHNGSVPSRDNEPTYLKGLGNAGYWYEKLESNSDFPSERLNKTTPQLGAIACWKSESRANIGWGHVAVVEDIKYDENGNWTSFQYSHSGYTKPLFGTGIYKSSYSAYPGTNGDYKLEGFIYADSSFLNSFLHSWYPIANVTQTLDTLTLKLVDNPDFYNNTTVSLQWSFPTSISNDTSKFTSNSHLNISFTIPQNTSNNTIDVPIPYFANSMSLYMETTNKDNNDNKNFSMFTDVEIGYPCAYINGNPHIPLLYTKQNGNGSWSPRVPYIAYKGNEYPLKIKHSLEPIILYTNPLSHLLGVTHYKQQYDYTCGPAAALMILNYFKVTLPSNATLPYDKWLYHNIAGVTGEGGTGPNDNVKILNTYLTDSPYSYKHYTKLGSEGTYVNGIRDVIEKSLLNNYPLMIHIKIEDMNLFQYTSTSQWVVIDGLDKSTDEIHICDPASSKYPYRSIDLTTFLTSYFFIDKDRANIIAYFPTT